MSKTTWAMRTDRYELAMLAAAARDGLAERGAVFELFTRRLPAGRRFGVLVGMGRFLDLLDDVRFAEDDLRWLRDEAGVGAAVVDACEAWRFSGDIDAIPEGTTYQPGEPLVRVRGSFADGVILETLLLSLCNADSAVASAAARIRLAAGDRSLAEMGGRRVDPDVAVAAARATYIAGFDATSNLEAGRRYGVPTIGTMAHAWILAHRTEDEAFASWVATHGTATTFLVDTYDIRTGIEAAIAACAAAGGQPGGVRIDSGDLRAETLAARAQLDAAGCTEARIVLSGDLDDEAVAALASAPVDTYGVGTDVVCGGGAPTCSMVYKLVAVEDPDGSWRSVAKRSAGKVGTGGMKAVRRVREAEHVRADELHLVDPEAALDSVDDLLVPLVRGGVADLEHAGRRGTAAARIRCAAALAELPAEGRLLAPGTPAWTATLTEVPSLLDAPYLDTTEV